MHYFFVASLSTAAMTAIIVESPIGRFFREQFAGEPTKEDWAEYRSALARGAAVEENIPVAGRPRLSEALSCPRCVGFWAAGLAALLTGGSDHTVASWAFLWGAAWIGGRLLLGACRLVEYHSGE